MEGQVGELNRPAAAVIPHMQPATPSSLGPALIAAAGEARPGAELLPVLGCLMRVPAPPLELQQRVETLLVALMRDALVRGEKSGAIAVQRFIRLGLQANHIFAPGWRRTMIRTSAKLLGPEALHAVLTEIDSGATLATYAWLPAFFGAHSNCAAHQILNLIRPAQSTASTALVAEILNQMGVEGPTLDQLYDRVPPGARELIETGAIKVTAA